MMTLQNNIDLLAVDMTLTRMYDMVVELEDKLSESGVIAVKKVPIDCIAWSIAMIWIDMCAVFYQ